MYRFSLRLDEKAKKKLKNSAQKRNTSMNSLLKEVIDSPNLATGNWFDDTTAIRKVAQQLKKELRK